MIFQWYLFVLLIAVAIFAKVAGQTYTIEVHGRKERHYGWIPVLMVAVPLILLAGFRGNIGDTYAYRIMYQNTEASLSAIPGVLAKAGKDKGFSVFTILLKHITRNSDELYFTVIAAICIMCVLTIYKKHSCNFMMSMFLFIASSDYVQWNYNGMRQFIAVAVIFVATDWLVQKKYVRYFLLIALMSTIHATAWIMIPVSLIVQGKAWNLRSVLFTIAVLIAINFSGALSNLIVEFMSDTQYSGEVNQFLETDGTNILRVFVFVIPPLLALLFKKWLNFANDRLINLSVNMSIVSMGAYIVSAVTSGIFIGRIPIYFSLYNYILLPWLVENVFEKRSQKLVYGCLMVCYMIFYWFQMTVAWGFSSSV